MTERLRSVYLPPWRVDVSVRPGIRSPASVTSLARTMSAALATTHAPSPASIGLILSNDRELAELNLAHMGEQGPTDVLSFPLLPPDAFAAQGSSRRRVSTPRFVLPPGRRVHLGDVVVSVERAIEQAVEGRGGQTGDVRWSPADEMRLLVTHGTLHVCGWDHTDAREEAAMRGLERTLLA